MQKKILIIILVGIFLLTNMNSILAIEINEGKNDTKQIMSIEGDGKTEYWALLVGVGEYAESNEYIPYMLDVTDDLYETLLKSHYWSEDHIKVLKGKEATLSNIIKGLQWLDQMEDDDDISLIFIFTHGGVLDMDIPPRDEADGRDEMLVTYWGFAYPFLNLLDDVLNLFMSRLESKGTCLILSSCYSGGFNDPPYNSKVRGLTRQILQRLNPFSPSQRMRDFGEDRSDKGRVVLTSSREDEESVLMHYSPYLIDALRGFADFNNDDIITAEEVHNYTKQRTPKWYQHPTIYDSYEGELPLLEISEPYYGKYSEEKNIKKHESQDIISTQLISDENSIVRGYIKDNETQEPIANANISLYWRNVSGWPRKNYYSYSDDFGFYSINITAGVIVDITVRIQGYFPNYSILEYEIGEEEVLWFNITMDSWPPETSKVCGYITDSVTNEPIENADVQIIWWDKNQSYLYYENTTKSNALGFYQINVAAGKVGVKASANGYFPKSTWIAYDIDENSTLWENLSLDLRPLENSVVCGYITDFKTNRTLSDINVNLKWHDFSYKNENWNHTKTNSSGFYYINVPEGKIYVNVYKDTYLQEYSDLTNIGQNEILWINLSLYSKPPKNSVICGFLTDSETNEPMANANVYIRWIGCEWHHMTDTIYADDQGFYTMNISAGELYIDFTINYQNHEVGRQDIGENETLWFNISLDRVEIEIEIKKPLTAIYSKNDLKFPFFKPLIFGDIEIEIYVWNVEEVDRVEFYIDGKLKANITGEPDTKSYSYNWTREGIRILGHQHNIKVVAFDKTGKSGSGEITVWKFF